MFSDEQEITCGL